MSSIYLFYFFSALSLFSAMMVLVSKKPIHSALYLTLTFFALSGHFILLNAQFIAVVNVIVYTGAIMVLFLFTVMLLNLNVSYDISKPKLARIAAVIAGGLLMVTILGALIGVDLSVVKDPAETQIGMVKNLGKVLFSDFLLPFEISSILFLSAMIGAVMLGKKANEEI